MMARWKLNLPGGGEDRIHYGVFVISGTEQKDVLYRGRESNTKAIYYIAFICTENIFFYLYSLFTL